MSDTKFIPDEKDKDAVRALNVPACKVEKGNVIITLDERAISEKRLSFTPDDARVFFNLFGRMIQLAEFSKGEPLSGEMLARFAKALEQELPLQVLGAKN